MRRSICAWCARRKKRLLFAVAVLSLLAGTLFVLVFTRFNFSQGTFPRLAWAQEALGINQFASVSHTTPQIIAHRGSGLTSTTGSGFIGNTVKAIQTGVDSKAAWIEIDIRRSQDGVLMVFHDEEVDRVTNGKGKFSQLRQEEIQRLRINVNPVETVPTLREVFEEFSSQDARFVLDIKVRDVKDQVLALVESHFPRDRIILIGTSEILQDYVGCGYRLGYTVLWSEGWNKYAFLFGNDFILQRCDELDCDYLILPIIFVNQSLVAEAKSRGLNVWAYGSEDKGDWRRNAKLGVTGLIVDEPTNAVQTF